MRGAQHETVRVRLLGTVCVVDIGGGALPVGGAKSSAVFALLALHAGTLVTTEQLIDGVWGEKAPASARSAVQVYASGLRQLLLRANLETGAGSGLDGSASGYVLNVDRDRIDVFVAQRMLTTAQLLASRSEYDAAIETTTRALVLWSGPELVNVGDAPFAELERPRMTRLRLDLLEVSAEAGLALGRNAEVIRLAEGVVAQQLYDEGWWRRLIVALQRSGRTAEALAAYASLRSRMRDDLGLDPGLELSDLQASILRGDPVVASLPAALTAAPTRRVLPDAMTPLVGRRAEIADLVHLVQEPGVRLVTLTGPGGTGKTRLAVSVAEDTVDGFADGTFFVPLAAVTDAQVMWTSMGETLGLPPELRTPLGLVSQLESLSVLLVLDNLEQISGAGQVVSELLHGCRRVTVVATSRRPLHLEGEHEYAVPPLTLPSGSELAEVRDSSAVALFVQRAQRVRSTFALTDANAADIARLCAQMDGLPLAIELTAARTKLLSPSALTRRIDQMLTLDSPGVDRPPRQQTLGSTIAWSYDLLATDQRTLFRSLAVFAGPTDLEAVDAVTSDVVDGDALELVTALVDASLVTVSEDSQGEPRVGALQTIRSFARDRLRADGEEPRAELAAALHYAAKAASWAAQMNGAPEVFIEVRRQFELDHDNIRAALTWSLGSQTIGVRSAAAVRTGQGLCADLWRLWTDGGYVEEGRTWGQRAVDQSPDPESAVLGRCLTMLAEFEILQKRFLPARAVAQDAVAMGRRLGDPQVLAGALVLLARCEHNLGEIESARATFDEAIRCAEAIPNKQRVLAEVFGALAYMEMGDSRFERSLELQQTALALNVELGDERRALYCRQNIACTLRLVGRLTEAETLMRAQVTPVLRLANADLLIILAEDYAAVLAELDRPRPAVRLLGAADAHRDRTNMPRLPQQEDEIKGSIQQARAALSPAQWQYEHASGRGMSVSAAIRRAYDENPA